MTDAVPSTRERLIHAMSQALPTRGYHGVGLNELLTAAGAPKGVLYHHFPGGKAELGAAAIDASAQRVADALDRAFASPTDPVDVLAGWLTSALSKLEESGFERGCPLGTVALESRPEDVRLQNALADAFASLRGRLAAALVNAGMKSDRAPAIASLVVAAYEGALMQARVGGTVAPMREAMAALLESVRRALSEVDS